MEASARQLQNLLEGTKQYVVPLFQRPYSWTNKQWSDLWEDLEFLKENLDSPNHFMGAVVTMAAKSVPEGVAKFLLIDGQQRLTTLFILLIALRQRARAIGSMRQADKIQELFLYNKFADEPNDQYRLLPTKADRPAFFELVNGGSVELHGEIANCYRYFDRKLASVRDNAEIDNIITIVTKRLSVVSIVLDANENAHVIFQSLNAKGLTLTQADLIRNYIFMYIHRDEQEADYAKYWQPMEQQLGDKLSEFIRHYLLKDGGAFVKEDSIYITLKARHPQATILPTLQSLSAFAAYYARLVNPGAYERDVRIRSGLEHLNTLGITSCYPFLLNCYDDYMHDRLSADEFNSILATLETMIIRRYMCGQQTSGLNKIFPSLYRQAREKGDHGLLDGVQKHLVDLRMCPSDAEFRARIEDFALYGAGQKRDNARLILEQLEMSYPHKERAMPTSATLDHVMPQKLTSDWSVDEESHTLLVHTLGNLTLTGYNSEMSNDAYLVKREYYRSSHFMLNHYFDSVDIWGPDQIQARTRALAEQAIKVWPYFGALQYDSETILTAASVTGTTPVSLVILGQFFPNVQSWRTVVSTMVDEFYALDSDRLTEALKDIAKLSEGSNGKRAPYDIGNGLYIDLNQKAKTLYSWCTRLVEAMGFSADDWKVEIR